MNSLLIVLDDLGKERALDWQLMPRLARARDEGMEFANAYSMALCVPSRATLMTGRYPWETGWCGHWSHWSEPASPTLFESGFPILPEAVEAAARPICAGKWQLGDAANRMMAQLGWDDWLCWDGDYGPEGSTRYSGNRLFASDPALDGLAPAFSEHVFTAWLVEEMLRTRRKGHAFAAYYPLLLPHRPIVAPPGSPAPSLDEMCRYADGIIGTLLDVLTFSGLAAETLVLITSDNGTDLGGEADEGKGALKDSGVNVPFVAWGGGVRPGTVSEQMVDFTDVLPTLCDWHGVAPPETSGQSFSHALRGEPPPAGARETALATGLGIMRRQDGTIAVNRPEVTRRAAYRTRYALVPNANGARVLIDRATWQPATNGANAARKMAEALDALPPDRRLS